MVGPKSVLQKWHFPLGRDLGSQHKRKTSQKRWALVTCRTTGTSRMATARKTHKSQKHLYLCVWDPYDYAPKVWAQTRLSITTICSASIGTFNIYNMKFYVYALHIVIKIHGHIWGLGTPLLYHATFEAKLMGTWLFFQYSYPICIQVYQQNITIQNGSNMAAVSTTSHCISTTFWRKNSR